MKTYDVWCSVNVPLVVTVEEPDEDSATLKVEHMFQRGELQGLILRAVIDGLGTIDIDEVVETEEK